MLLEINTNSISDVLASSCCKQHFLCLAGVKTSWELWEPTSRPRPCEQNQSVRALVEAKRIS